jgi:hypothetical protein
VKYSRRILIVILGVALLAKGGMPAKVQQTIGHYFSETGHNVTGEFWVFYQSAPDAAQIFGGSITDQFQTVTGLA